MTTRSRPEGLTLEGPNSSIVRRLVDYAEMTKPRIVGLVGIATLGGFYLGASGNLETSLVLQTLLGTVLLGCGANALNMYLERHSDRMMRRTENRPLPADRIHPSAAFRFGMVSWLGGFAYLAFFTNWLTAFIGWSTVVLYLFAYTPLKKKSVLSTMVGAIPGALPPLIGWTAAGGRLSVEALSLFSILFFWQLPHFMAIAWMHRKDYERAGMKNWAVADVEGRLCAQQAVLHTLILIPVSLTPTLLGLAGNLYLTGAFFLGLVFLGFCFRFLKYRTVWHARQLFFYSVVYLPVLFVFLMLDSKGGGSIGL